MFYIMFKLYHYLISCQIKFTPCFRAASPLFCSAAFIQIRRSSVS